jgi:hypothetical protein
MEVKELATDYDYFQDYSILMEPIELAAGKVT